MMIWSRKGVFSKIIWKNQIAGAVNMLKRYELFSEYWNPTELCTIFSPLHYTPGLYDYVCNSCFEQTKIVKKKWRKKTILKCFINFVGLCFSICLSLHLSNCVSYSVYATYTIEIKISLQTHSSIHPSYTCYQQSQYTGQAIRMQMKSIQYFFLQESITSSGDWVCQYECGWVVHLRVLK